MDFQKITVFVMKDGTTYLNVNVVPLTIFVVKDKFTQVGIALVMELA